jgi:redox-sensitive bicupin YhaK (pirin superfamily)
MPAITVEDTLVLPRLSSPDPTSRPRPVAKIVTARHEAEGAGFIVARPFPGELPLTEADPFLLLDHVGPLVNGPGEAKGAPWHPHRGIETVSYILDGEVAHHDSNGGGGVIAEGDTQWMTAGGGILPPITYAHVTLAPGAQLSVPWSPDFSAFAYVLTGRGTAGHDQRPIDADQLVVFGPGGHVVLTAAGPAEPLELLVFGGLPIRAPIVHYGPFVMNTRAEILQAIDDYQAGRLGTIPADQLTLRRFA